MKAFLAGLVAAVAIAIAAAVVLDTEVQRSAADHFQTESVRL
ncbi:MAG: hypothetical protein AVDCRST_MAG27-4452 [uncultured Craurococcus sp.]|uniref:Uncharacterized protein n=1 Tax=uncultured Craurococcus sp. TaxID=1135998 RepID=A0A6J4JS00_9PROT|nr:MAG: hypothetical protein AVDCRST_MAG27-4452 [uncultured Craurococcus sp.]